MAKPSSPGSLPSSWRDTRAELRRQRRRWLKDLARRDDADDMEVRAFLVKKHRYYRQLLVDADGGPGFIVEYFGSGFGSEFVRVDREEVAREPSPVTMAERFFFLIGERPASIEIEAGHGANLLGPLWPPGLRMFLLVVDDRPLYADGRAYEDVRRELGGGG